MTQQTTNEPVSDLPANPPSLTEEISAFTASAERRLPHGYIDAFRALVARLIEQGIGNNAPAIGAHFPDFELQDDAGNLVRASNHWKERTLIAKFYRGGWCPYCNLELAALQRKQQDFESLGADIFAIAPERSQVQTETKARASATFKFLWDRDNAFARKLGIAFPVDQVVKEIYLKLGIDLGELNGAWELPVAATFVVKDGWVRRRVVDADYLQRRDPIDLLAWLRADAQLDA